MKMRNTILYGNGINRLNPSNISWDDLLNQIKGLKHFENSSLPYTMIYERILMEKPKINLENIFNTELEVKQRIAEELQKTSTNKNYTKLFELNADNYITTNYDYAFKNTFNKSLKYSTNEKSTEDIYSIRRAIQLLHKNKVVKTIWHIHGEINKPKSIMLGLDHYCGSIGKINNYIKGNYKFQKNNESVELKSIKEKLINNHFDEISWVELFFTTNIHIMGFGLDYSEIDLWWVLIKRARLMKDSDTKKLIKNRIVFYVHQLDEFKKGILNSLNVTVESTNTKGNIKTNKYWQAHFNSLFKKLQKSIKYSKVSQDDLFLSTNTLS